MPKRFNSLMPIILVLVLFCAGMGILIYKKQKIPVKEYGIYKSKTELEVYINDALDSGYEEEQIRHSLLKAGWSKEEIDRAFSKLK